jgi:hypothetical protein
MGEAREGMTTDRFKRFDEMVWPDPHKLSDLAWRLTWSPDSITCADKMLLTSVIQAYRQIVIDPRAKREHVCRKLREDTSKR